MRKKVSMHAHLRGMERGGVSNKKIKEIMAYGYSPVEFEGDFRSFLMSVQSARGGAVTVKVKEGIVVIYNKRSQKAITTYPVPTKYMPWEEYLVKGIRKKVLADGDGSAEESEQEVLFEEQGVL